MSTYGNRAPVLDAPPLPEHAGLAEYRVLLVEDDPDYGRMVERVLRSAQPPFWVDREDRLAAGLFRLERDHYDALVMDLKLPDADGRSTLRNACEQANQLPVVVLTSTDDDGLALDAIRGGAEDYLVKQRTRALALPGAVLRAIERHRRNGAKPRGGGIVGGVADRIELRGQLTRALARASRRRAPVAVMIAGYADLDWLTEAFVPSAIEQLGVRAAERLALRVRGGDVLARLDATRFAVVIEGDADRAQLEGIAQGLRAVMQGIEIELERGVVMGLEACVGISLHPGQGDDPQTLLEKATAAWEDAASHDGVRFYADGKRE